MPKHTLPDELEAAGAVVSNEAKKNPCPDCNGGGIAENVTCARCEGTGVAK